MASFRGKSWKSASARFMPSRARAAGLTSVAASICTMWPLPSMTWTSEPEIPEACEAGTIWSSAPHITRIGVHRPEHHGGQEIGQTLPQDDGLPPVGDESRGDRSQGAVDPVETLELHRKGRSKVATAPPERNERAAHLGALEAGVFPRN